MTNCKFASRRKVVALLLFIIVVIMIHTFRNINYDRQHKDISMVDTDNVDYYFVPTLYSVPIDTRISSNAEDYFFFSEIPLGGSCESLFEEYGWLKDYCEDYSAIPTDQFAEGITLKNVVFTSEKDIIILDINVANCIIDILEVKIEYDVSNPSYEDFISLSKDFFEDFMRFEGIDEMNIMDIDGYRALFQIQEDVYNEAGYVTNEITCREYIDEENKVIYSFVTEHYTKENPDKTRSETENIAKISYSKALLP